MTQQESEPQKEAAQEREKLEHGVDETDQQAEQHETGKQQERAGAAEDESAGLDKLKWDRLVEEGGGSEL